MKQGSFKYRKQNTLLGAGLVVSMCFALLFLSCGICYAGMGGIDVAHMSPLIFRVGITELFILFIVPIIAVLLHGIQITFGHKIEERWFKGMSVAWLLNFVFMLVTSFEFLVDLKHLLSLPF